MLNKIPIVMMVLGLCASGASAQDLCFRYLQGGGGIFVAKATTLPGPNTCKPFNAAEKLVPGGGNIIGGMTGTLCRTFSNELPDYVLHYSSHGCFVPKNGASYFESGFCRFNGRPPIKGPCRGTVVTAHPTKPIEGAGFLLDAELTSCNELLTANVCPP
jgi:hypothetical protein